MTTLPTQFSAVSKIIDSFQFSDYIVAIQAHPAIHPGVYHRPSSADIFFAFCKIDDNESAARPLQLVFWPFAKNDAESAPFTPKDDELLKAPINLRLALPEELEELKKQVKQGGVHTGLYFESLPDIIDYMIGAISTKLLISAQAGASGAERGQGEVLQP